MNSPQSRQTVPDVGSAEKAKGKCMMCKFVLIFSFITLLLVLTLTVVLTLVPFEETSLQSISAEAP